MICIECRKAHHDDCVNIEKGTVTWCGCQHKSGVILQFSDCHHTGATATWCPTCGKVWDDPTNSDGEDTTEEPIDLGFMSLPPIVETNKDEGVTYTYDKDENGSIKSALPRRYKETPSS